MKGKSHDRKLMYDGGTKRTAGYGSIDTTTRRARRIAQRLAILEDSSLPRELRERAHKRMGELEAEANGDE